MNHGFSIADAAAKRCSVRTYEKTPLAPQMKQQLLDYANTLTNPLGPNIRIQFIEKDAAEHGEKLGTYGIIRGARTYMAVTVPDEPHAPEAVGYEFEQLVLYAASLGLGTCWLGGTFNRSAFAAQIEIREGEVFPILSPVGLPKKQRISEQLFRRSLSADKRKPWETLFFQNGLTVPLTREAAGPYAHALDMVRLAPSAVNRQPWRVAVCGNAVHFFVKRMVDGEAIGTDMQRIDLGIAICHFHLAVQEAGLTGHFERNAPDFPIPGGTEYIASWILD